jgi:hypothetical protein
MQMSRAVTQEQAMSPPPVEETASDADKKAQQARSKKYHIAVKDGGNVTRPAQWKNVPDSEWGDPVNYAYPMPDKAHADNAAARWGDASNRARYSGAEQKIIGDRIAARQRHFGEKPGTTQGSGKKEALPPVGGRKLATITTRWLEDNAISLNGRQYPPEAVDRLIQSAQVTLSDPDALPLTCYLSHEDADHDVTRHLCGRITAVWREGPAAMATIDIPDTEAGRDTVSLVAGGYIRSQSLRARGAEMKIDNDHTFPLVGGANLKLEGIDFTTSPGLPTVARITDLALAESHDPGLQRLIEVFTAHDTDLLLEQQVEGVSMPNNSEGSLPLPEAIPSIEEANVPVLTGNSPSMDGSTQDADGWASRNMPIPPLDAISAVSGAPLPAGHPVMEALRQMHDHVARVLDAHLGSIHGSSPSQEASRGKRLMPHQVSRLVDAHDTAARHLTMECEGGYEPALSRMSNGGLSPDGMQDGDDDDGAQERTEAQPSKPEAPVTPPPVREARPFTRADAVRLLQREGYKLTPPPTREEIMQRQFEARLAAERAALKQQMEEQATAQAKQFEELKQLLAAQQQNSLGIPQRRSLAEGVAPAPLPQAEVRRPSYIQEQITNADPWELIDRSRPLPEAIDQNLERVLAEYQKVLLGMVLLNPDGTLAY